MDGCPGLMLIAGDKGVSINLGELEHISAELNRDSLAGVGG
jgi:hypothetical protein